MPTDAQSGGGYGGIAKPKKKSVRKVRPAAPPVTDVQSTGGYTPPPRTLVRPVRPKAPVSDVRSSGKHYGIPQADRYKKTKGYKKVVKQVQETETKRALVAALHDVAATAHGAQLTPVKVKKTFAAGPGSSVAGLGPADLLKYGGLVARNVGAAVLEDPDGVAKKTIKGGVDAVTGFPGQVGQVALPLLKQDPVGTAKAVERIGVGTVKDYARRYGPLLSGNEKEFRDRIKQEGAFPELLDMAGAKQIGDLSLGKPTVEAAKRGAFGSTAKSVTTGDRPALRTSGNTVRPQELSDKPLKLIGQRTQDQVRVVVNKRRNAKADREDRGRPGLQPVQSAVEKSVARHNLKVVGRGEKPVVLVRRPAEVVPASRRLTAKAQVKDASRVSAQAYVRNRNEQARELSKGTERDLAGLSHAQRRAVTTVSQGLVPIHGTIEQIKSALDARVKQIEKYKADPKNNAKDAPRLYRGGTELETLKYLSAHAEKVFGDGRLADFHARNLERNLRVAEDDPGLRSATAEKRRRQPQGEVLGVPYDPPIDEKFVRLDQKKSLDADERAHLDEYHREYAAAVQAKADAAVLPEPMYVPHAKRPTAGRVQRTTGNVSRAIRGPKQTEMRLFNEGRSLTNPDMLTRGMAKAIKRKHQWRAVADVFDRNAMPWGRNLSAEKALDQIDHRGLDRGDFVLMDAGIMRRGAGDTSDGALSINDRLHEAVKDPNSDSFVKTAGYDVVPRAVADELLANTKPPNRALRLAGKAQGLQSALILGTNPSWLQMQVAANALQSGFGMHGNLLDWARSQKWYHDLSPAQKVKVDDAIGVGVFEGHTQVPRMGASGGQVSAVLHDAGQIPVLRTRKGTVRVTDLNPMQVMFHLDGLQNAAFRRAVLFNELKRHAYRDLAENTGRAQTAMQSLSELLHLRPGETVRDQLNRTLENPQKVEQAAAYVDDVLGDFLRYTAKERAQFKPFVMFYGFLRYATKTLFYTLPIKHPMAAAIGAKLGQLHDEEVKRIFGTRDGIPPWVYSRVYEYNHDGSVKRDKDGRPYSTDLGRINPVTGPILDVASEGAPAIAGLVSPLFQGAFNIVARKNVQSDRPLRTHGSASAAKPTSVTDIARILGNQSIESTFPGRLLMPKGDQGDDALPFSPRPIIYKTKAARDRAAQRDKTRLKGGDALVQGLFPLAVPRPDTTTDYLKSHGNGPTAKIDQRLKVIETALTGLKNTGRYSHGDYYTLPAQRLLDERNHLRARKRKLLKAKPPKRLRRVPLTPEQQIQRDFRDYQSEGSSPDDQVRKEFEQFANGQ